MNVNSLLNAVNNVFTTYNPPDRQVYKRIVKRSGGDDLIGRPGSITYQDSVLTPQPFYQRRQQSWPPMNIGSNASRDEAAEKLLGPDGKSYAAVAYEILLAPQSITVDDLNNPNLTLLFKFSNGNEEEYEVTDYETVGVAGVDLLIIGYIKSVTRPN